MDLREALYIVNIYSNNGISKAAKHLSISQSSLSRCLQGIEDTIGEPLFLRTSGEYTPTYIGQQYLTYARQLLEVEQEWKHSLIKHKNPEYGCIKLSIDSLYSATILPDVIHKFRNAYPFVNLEISESHSNNEEQNNFDLNISIVESNRVLEDDLLLGYDEILLCSSQNNKIIDKSFHVDGCHYRHRDKAPM